MAALFTLAELLVFAMMLGIGMRVDAAARRPLREDRGVLFRGLASVLFVVPLVAFGLLALVRLDAAMATGIAILAASPGAPMTTRRVTMGGGDPIFSSNLQLTSALLAVLVTPLLYAAFYGFFDLLVGRIGPWTVVGQVAKVTFLPAGLGFAIQRIAPRWTSSIEPWVAKLANVLLALMGLALVAALIFEPRLRGKLDVGLVPIAAVVAWVVLSLVLGHALGGPSRKTRAAVAIAGIARNLGLALYILGLSDAGQDAVPMVFVYAVVGFVLAIPYGIFIKRGPSPQEAHAG